MKLMLEPREPFFDEEHRPLSFGSTHGLEDIAPHIPQWSYYEADFAYKELSFQTFYY